MCKKKGQRWVCCRGFNRSLNVYGDILQLPLCSRWQWIQGTEWAGESAGSQSRARVRWSRHPLLSFVLVWGNSTVCLLKGKHRNDVAVGGVQPQKWVDVSPSPSLKSDGNTSDRLQTRGCVTAGVWLDLSNNNPVRLRIRSLFEYINSILYAI